MRAPNSRANWMAVTPMPLVPAVDQGRLPFGQPPDLEQVRPHGERGFRQRAGADRVIASRPGQALRCRSGAILILVANSTFEECSGQRLPKQPELGPFRRRLMPLAPIMAGKASNSPPVSIFGISPAVAQRTDEVADGQGGNLIPDCDNFAGDFKAQDRAGAGRRVGPLPLCHIGPVHPGSLHTQWVSLSWIAAPAARDSSPPCRRTCRRSTSRREAAEKKYSWRSLSSRPDGVSSPG